MKWFGERTWSAELCTKARKAPIPRKASCTYCKVDISNQDRGVINDEGAYHLHCFVSLVIGQK